MALSHTPLDPATLGPEAQRALASPGSKLMAARGLAPIPNPRDLVAVLYHLAAGSDDKLRSMAEGSVGELPEAVVRGGLADPGQDPRVLDYFAGRLLSSPDLLDVIITNSATQSETVAELAARAPEAQCELIAQNQERLLAAPAIIAALYGNRSARMSTIDRVVELAVRRQVKVSGIPSWEELCRVYGGERASSGEMVEVDAATLDSAFARASGLTAGKGDDPDAVPDTTPEEETKELWALPVPVKIRLATLGNAFDRAVLVRDPKKIVAIAAIKSPGMTENEAAKYATNTGLCEEVISYIANRRDWTRLYTVKMALVNNPKCPLPTAMRLLPLLREKDVQQVARSKGIPSSLAAQARKLVMQRKAGRG
jgi:hypothetical protein